MCFNITSSLVMMVVGIVGTIYSYLKLNGLVAFGIFYFTLMEIIHVFGYLVINKCDNKLNQLLAYLNYIHISFQPFIFTLFVYGLLRFYNLTKVNFDNFKIVLGLSLVASFFMLSRLFGKKTSYDCNLCGKTACVSSGKHHLKIETPLRTTPEYFTPNIFIHFLFFFIPALFLGKYGIMMAIFIFITFIGLILGLKIKATEGATVWCLASTGQLIFLIFFAIFFANKNI